MQATPSLGTQAAAFEMLMNAIGSTLTSVIQQLLSSDPNLVHFRGWHGMTPLHRACLIGEYNVVLLLTQANADVNALNNFSETPLHYASKRGMPTVVHLLLQCGAKIELRDKRGRSALHHAAENGAVDVVRYFQDAFNLDLQTLDNSYQSALHIACVYGHLDLFFHLLNSGNGDLWQLDLDGNLPIHITAKNGFGHMTWTLLSIMGSSALKKKNKAGMTPYDLASQSDSYGHQELIPVLRRYASWPESRPVHGPLWGWYFRHVFPFNFYLALVVISQHMTSQQYLLFGAGFLLAAGLLRTLRHRINHVTRWPEPFYAGFFYGGVLHTTLCFFWLMFPYGYTRWWVLALSLSTIPALHYVYYKLITTEPGYVTSPARDPGTGKVLTMVDLCQMRNPPYRFCHICQIIVSMDTKHCKLCERCFVRMDHHCLFLLRCVARDNHTLFLWLLLLGAANMALYCMSFALYTQELYSSLSWSEIWSHLINQEAWPLTLLILNSLSFCWSVNVLLYQFHFVSTGRTAYFNKAPKGYKVKELTRLQRLINFCHFLLYRPLPHSTFELDADSSGDSCKTVRSVGGTSQDCDSCGHAPDIHVV
ncbi:palmitoyltransferase [Plakobranchus ocellatus]|uniref:Palmitoyltransferase n=1 Tax=Plakobranchus ocellatus TaxID=259542 RepID=A0AAV4CCU0_9GAST|nr:palmitoyltransferase [Plakobranchus ocellatus]